MWVVVFEDEKETGIERMDGFIEAGGTKNNG